MISAIRNFFRVEQANEPQSAQQANIPQMQQHHAEWVVVKPEILDSEIYAATEGQGAFNPDIIKIVSDYLQYDTFFQFSPKDWNSLVGRVEIIEYPPEIERVLNDEDPFNPGKLIKETCFLFYIPDRVHNIPLTLNYVKTLLPADLSMKVDSRITHAFGESVNDRSYWILMHKNLIPNKPSPECMDRAQKEKWELSSVREAAITHYIRQITENIRQVKPEIRGNDDDFRVCCAERIPVLEGHPCLTYRPSFSNYSGHSRKPFWAFHTGATKNDTVFVRKFS